MKIIKSIMVMLLVLLASVSFVSAASDGYSNIKVSLVNQDPNPVIAGDIVEIRLGIENTGYDIAKNIIIEAKNEYPFEVVSNNIEEISSIQATNVDGTNTQTIKFKLKVSGDISAGSYEFIVKEYSSTSLNLVTEHSVFIDVKTKESLEIESIENSEILPGKKETITFKLKNVGSSILRDVVFSWENEEGVILPVGSDNSEYIKSIEVGEMIDVSFDILASASAVADLYNVNLKVSYQDSISSVDSEYITNTGIYVGGDTSFDLVFDEFENGEYAFTISNIGANNAESVTIKVPKQDGWTLSSGSSEIIGNLNKGDYTTVSFAMTKIQVQNINLIVDYTNTLGERVSIEKTVDVFGSAPISEDGSVVKTGTRGGMGGMTSGVNSIVVWAKYAAYLIGGIIVLIVGLKIFKKKRKN